MYRVVEESGPNNNAVFLWFLDPTVANANYAVPQLLNEMFPAEVQQLYEGYVQSFGVGQMVLNLEPVVLVGGTALTTVPPGAKQETSVSAAGFAAFRRLH